MYGAFAAEKAREIAKNFSGDDVLDALGLVRKSQTSWFWHALSGFGVGMLVGVGVGLAFAPKKGSELRGDLTSRLREKQYEATQSAREALNKTEERGPVM